MAVLSSSLITGWVSFLAVRAGAPLARTGHPALALSLTLFEVGREF